MIESTSNANSVQSQKEQRIRALTSLYYSRPDIQKAIFEFSKNRETVPRYFEGFGKRPDYLQYPGDVFELVKKGATSFHASEEIWEDPLEIQTGMTEEKLNSLRKGWDLLIDIDCKWFDFSKKAARAIIDTLKSYGVKNVGLKFSGSKGFHIMVPWNSFPKEIAGELTKNLFPQLPRKIVSFLKFKAETEMAELISEEELKQFQHTEIRKGKKCNNCKNVAREYLLVTYFCPKCKRQEFKKIAPDNDKRLRCPDCRIHFETKDSKEIYECSNCNISSEKNPRGFSRHIELDLFEIMGLDLILVSPRHLFRTPYSLHEKTALASVVISEQDLEEFDIKDANPSKIKIKNFIPVSKEGEAEKFVREALDWHKENQIKKGISEEKITGKYADFKPIKLEKFSDSFLPPSILTILKGVDDGRKRALFVLLNMFRFLGLEKEDIEKRISDWNKKNKVPLLEGYIKAQLIWSYRNKPVLPPNFDKDYYRAIGVIPTQEEVRAKNPVTYVLMKAQPRKQSKKDGKNKDNFKNNN